MKKLVFTAVVLAATLPVSAGDMDFLTGDEKLACETILCLSVPDGERPDECKPSIERYLSIKHRKASKTHEARTEYLKKCPWHQDESGGDEEKKKKCAYGWGSKDENGNFNITECIHYHYK